MYLVAPSSYMKFSPGPTFWQDQSITDNNINSNKQSTLARVDGVRLSGNVEGVWECSVMEGGIGVVKSDP